MRKVLKCSSYLPETQNELKDTLRQKWVYVYWTVLEKAYWTIS